MTADETIAAAKEIGFPIILRPSYVLAGRVPVIVPRENRQVMATVRGQGEEQVQIGDQRVPLFHLDVTPAGGDERQVAVDALGRVNQVQIPARNYVAVRSEIPA
jgi:biotin carboxylase